MGATFVRISASLPLRLRTAFGGIAALLCVLAGFPATGQESPPDEVRAVIEGTWDLVEWHVEGRILRPPEMNGRWMVHDGIVMATRHRQSEDGYESTAGYGTYSWGATTWTYGYDRSEDRLGSSPTETTLRVSEIPMRRFEITQQGDLLILEDRDSTLRWEYDISSKTFLLLGRDRQPIRKYRRID